MRDSLPLQFEAPLVVGSWSRLCNRQQVGKGLGWATSRLWAADDESLLLAAYRTWGTQCPLKLEGDFAFVVWDSGKGNVFATRDSMGVRPLYFAESAGRFAWASSAELLTKVEWVDRMVRQDWLAQYIARRSMDWRLTAITGIKKLPPGHWLIADGDTVRVERYHHFRDDAPWEDAREPHWLSDYQQVLADSVQERIDVAGPVGAEASGGLDSSTLVGMIAKLQPNAADSMHTFGFVRDDLETQYILETSRMWRIAFNHILSPPNGAALEHARRGWEALGYPAEHGNATSHIPFYELAQELGVPTLHSGHGGDEAVTNPGTKALVELVNHRAWRQALSDMHGPAVLRPARLARVWHRRRPREVSSLTAPLMGRLKWSILSREAIRVADIEQRTWDDARYDAPYDTVNGFILGDRLAPHISTRTAEGSIVAASYGVEYQWPLLDRRLVQQYLSTPAVWKYGEGFGRYLHRRAVAGIVPDKVAWKRTKSMWTPGGRNTARPEVRPEYALPSVGDLHPQLESIIDRDRVRLLAGRGSADQTRVVRNQLFRVVVLNTWLHERGG